MINWLIQTLFGSITELLKNNHTQTMANLQNLAATLGEIKSQLDKAKAEVVAKIADLESKLTNVELPADAVAALEALKGSAEGLDAIVPDAPVEEPAPVETPAEEAPAAPEEQ